MVFFQRRECYDFAEFGPFPIVAAFMLSAPHGGRSKRHFAFPSEGLETPCGAGASIKRNPMPRERPNPSSPFRGPQRRKSDRMVPDTGPKRVDFTKVKDGGCDTPRLHHILGAIANDNAPRYALAA